jgi:hypothetical protein
VSRASDEFGESQGSQGFPGDSFGQRKEVSPSWRVRKLNDIKIIDVSYWHWKSSVLAAVLQLHFD